MANVKKAKRKSKEEKVGFGVVLAGAAVAATAGAYYLYGPSGKKHRREVRGWMFKARGEVLERVEKLKEIDAKAYHSLVDEVSKKYKKLKHVNMQDVARLSRELKAHWTDIEKDLGKRTRSGKRVLKRVIRRVVKKTQVKKKAVSRKRPARRKPAVKRGGSKAKSLSLVKRTKRRR